MKTGFAILVVFTLLGSVPCGASALPELLNLVRVPATQAAAGETLDLQFDLKIPKGRKLTAKAPSRLRIYEQRGDGWEEVLVADIHDLTVTAKPKFQTRTAPIAFDLVVYHCGDTCAVTSFRGNIARKEKQMKKIIMALVVAAAPAFAQIEFSSGANQVSVIELYTSEGCSSCPPADRAFTELRDTSGVWKQFVPLAFHVDYWNSLGWRDPMSSEYNSNRQRAYGSTVATPAIKVNGDDAGGLGAATGLAGGNFNKAGVLKVQRVADHRFQVTYTPGAEGEWEANVALLGFGIVSNVTSGENAGNTFTHDFVVLGQDRAMLKAKGKGSYSVILEPQESRVSAAEYGVAAWVTAPGYLKPKQATGGMLRELQITAVQ